MPKLAVALGDQIEVARHHRLAGEEGVVVAIGDNPHSNRPSGSFHIRFDRDVWGAIRRREIWLGVDDFVVVGKAPAGYEPPTDIERPGPLSDDQ